MYTPTRMTAHQIREHFTKFFVKEDHKAWPSSSLLPDNDPSVLLTTAGMQQFKPFFLGELDPVKQFGAKRVTTIQKCFRTSDIDEVGDLSHLTFFEMLGNFSFADYGKKEAISLAWEFMTKVMHLDEDRLWVTVFAGDDDVPGDTEAAKEWQHLLPKERIVTLGREHNFWGPPGASGTCGPSTEIHWQLDPAISGTPKDQPENFLEIWNLVFTEYFSDKNKKLKKLPHLNIDTGMGLERLAMVVQKKDNIFATDLYQSILHLIQHQPDFGSSDEPLVDARRARIVADHLRGAAFLLADGVTFSNKEQGYILRRIVRRAADQYLTAEFTFDPIVNEIVGLFGSTYPELVKMETIIRHNLNAELEAYRKILCLDVKAIVEKMRKGSAEVIPREGMSHQSLTPTEAFTLYATHGITLDRLERLGFTFERRAVEAKISDHQELSRTGAKAKFGGHGLAHGPDTAGMTPEDIAKITRLHTATHLLHAALRKTLGDNVRQNGSDINPERLRFDFSFDRKLTDEEKKKVEDLVNDKITADLPVSFAMMPYADAIAAGALAFFKEKYNSEVKVYSMGDFSKELCGGPHVEHTSQVGKFTLESEKSIGTGLRRIKAVLA